MAPKKFVLKVVVRNPSVRRVSLRPPKLPNPTASILQRRRIAGNSQNTRAMQNIRNQTSFNVSTIRTPPALTTEIIKFAIANLANPNGSSHRAIAKYLATTYGVIVNREFRKRLSMELKQLVSVGSLMKMKRSYKIL